MTGITRTQLEWFLFKRFPPETRLTRSRDTGLLGFPAWQCAQSLGLEKLGENVSRHPIDHSLDTALRLTGRTTRSLLGVRLASERGNVLHLTTSPRWSRSRYLDLMGRSDMQHSPGPEVRARGRWDPPMAAVISDHVEPLGPAGAPPAGEVVFSSLTGATSGRDELRGRSFSTLSADHVVLEVLLSHRHLWKEKELNVGPEATDPAFCPIYEAGGSQGLRDGLGRTWSPGQPFTVPGLDKVGLAVDNIRLFGIVIGLVALFGGVTEPLCPAACDLLVPVGQ